MPHNRVFLIFLLAAILPSGAIAGAARSPHRSSLDVAELNEKGFTLLPAEAVFGAELMEQVELELSQPQARALASSKYGGGENNLVWDLPLQISDPEHRRLIGGAVKMANELTGFLERSLPEESLAPLNVEARATHAGRSSGAHGHADTGYLTATVSLRGPGTKLYRPLGDGRYSIVHVPERTIALLSNEDRELALGVPSALHSAPLGVVSDRLMLLVRFGDAYSAPAKERLAIVRDSIRERERTLHEFLLRHYPDFLRR